MNLDKREYQKPRTSSESSITFPSSIDSPFLINLPFPTSPFSALDDMVKASRGSGRKRGSGGRGGPRGGPRGGAKAAAVGGRNPPMQSSASNRGRAPVVFPGRNTGSKIVVSNLPLDVTEAQVKELFATTIGPLKKIQLAYKVNGQSSGVCHIEFQRNEDAGRSYTQYNQRLIDGSKSLPFSCI